MLQSFRVDKGRLGQARMDDHGNLLVTGVLTRTGVFKYTHKDGSITRELRHPDDVYNVDAVESFIQVPVTIDHPAEGRVTPQNVKRLSVGNLSDSIRRQDHLVVSDLIIRDHGAIKQVRGEGMPARRELSCGYTADVIPETGTYNGEKYDHRQTNIRGNHIAIVKKGRAGPVAKLLLDAADAEMGEDVTRFDELVLEIYRDDKLNGEQQSALSTKIKKIAEDHPDWENDRAVAAAYSMLGLDKGDIEDAEGEGSRGGHVIGHTSSGKPIYGDSGHDGHKEFSSYDHQEAAQAHDNLKKAAIRRAGDAPEGSKRMAVIDEVREHAGHAMVHRVNADFKQRRGDALNPGDSAVTIKIKKDAVDIGALHIDELVIECDEKDEPAVNKWLEQRKTLLDHLHDQHSTIETLQGKVDALEQSATDPKRLDELARERAELLLVAESTGLKKDALVELDNAEVKRQIVMKRYPTTKSDASDERIDGMFDIIKSAVDATKANRSKLNALGRLTSAAPINGPERMRADDTGEAEGGIREDGAPMTFREHAEAQMRADNAAAMAPGRRSVPASSQE